MELWTAFLLGLAGSLHCAGMCGPLVLALAKARPRTIQESTGRVCYHLGRVTSYSVLGLIFGFFGHVVAPAGFQHWLSIALGVALLASLLVTGKFPLAGPLWKFVSLVKRSMQGMLLRNSLASHVAMGALNALLPCGLVYVAAAGAAATAHPLAGAACMASFGLGTCPMMLGIHFAGQKLPLPARFQLGQVARYAVVLMAVLLIIRGLELGIPFVSPDMSTVTGGNGRCH